MKNMDASQQHIHAVQLPRALSLFFRVFMFWFFCSGFCFSLQGRQMAEDDNNGILSMGGL